MSVAETISASGQPISPLVMFHYVSYGSSNLMLPLKRIGLAIHYNGQWTDIEFRSNRTVKEASILKQESWPPAYVSPTSMNLCTQHMLRGPLTRALTSIRIYRDNFRPSSELTLVPATILVKSKVELPRLQEHRTLFVCIPFSARETTMQKG